MTDHIGARGPEFRVGSVIGRAVSVYFGNIVPILIISLIAYLPLIVLTVLFAASASNFEAMAQGQVPMGAVEVVGVVLFVVAAVVGWNWLSAGVTYGVIAALRQGRINLGEALGTSLRAVLPLIGLGVIAILVFALLALLNFIPIAGTIAFFVLMIYLLVRWWVVIPAIVVERIGPIAGLGRASALSKGNFWKILAVIVLWGVAAVIVAMIVQFAMLAATGVPLDLDGAGSVAQEGASGNWVVDLVSGIFNMIVVGLGASVVAVGYHDLRIAREGGDTEQIARAFD